jgi:hypothetical protein
MGTIVAHVGDQLTLRARSRASSPARRDDLPGLQAGPRDCNTKFNNTVNHMGFPFMPSVGPVHRRREATSP